MATKKKPAKKATKATKKRPRILKKGAKATKAARIAYQKGMRIPEGYIWTGGRYLQKTKNLRPIGSKNSQATLDAVEGNHDLVYGKKGKRKDKGALRRMSKLGNIYAKGNGEIAVDFSKDAKMSKILNEAGTGKVADPKASQIRKLQKFLDLTNGAKKQMPGVPKRAKETGEGAKKKLKKGHNVVFFGPDGHAR